MPQIAMFVDAGYVLAEGAALLTGRRQARADIRLDVTAMVACFRRMTADVEGAGRLLRIYWYDGLGRAGMSFEQQRICLSVDVKARFGRVNAHGQQKGVDTLLVTDLTELARSGAISDALILSGDEDIRIGVSLAQSHGVRVHLAGVPPVRDNQSVELQAEADTLTEVSEEQLRAWLQVATSAAPQHEADRSAAAEIIPFSDDVLGEVVAEQVARLGQDDLEWVQNHIVQTRGSLPRAFDGPSLIALSNRIGRELDEAERRTFRTRLVAAVSTFEPSAQAPEQSPT